MSVQLAVQKVGDDRYWIWGMKIPPDAAGLNNFQGPDFGDDEAGYRKSPVIDRLIELGLSEISACQLVDIADERGVTK
ncbi:hypothetical protein [Gluconobacter oxydans]|uniref:hypothetical protein n=1 Tax=Gluconobacter oxydans TaxID=442 RepID=UPI000784F9D1|nr:hypothetical protein [Gluconobacter oxydans]KXV13933.1 hypothetical protein AD932_03315 [Gluconobacter oxydans]